MAASGIRSCLLYDGLYTMATKSQSKSTPLAESLRSLSRMIEGDSVRRVVKNKLYYNPVGFLCCLSSLLYGISHKGP